ncbi:hypothetical protein RRG08_058516 [Elysia crispata]|uniref:Uncharacterized protein n=1 Tax=Elysia crispata TaxID=231223 RepID=A0AAE0ZXG7_9GAST|nr:hypothetical protein RRG08_058516 [Elysia crispata]
MDCVSWRCGKNSTTLRRIRTRVVVEPSSSTRLTKVGSFSQAYVTVRITDRAQQQTRKNRTCGSATANSIVIS